MNVRRYKTEKVQKKEGTKERRYKGRRYKGRTYNREKLLKGKAFVFLCFAYPSSY